MSVAEALRTLLLFAVIAVPPISIGFGAGRLCHDPQQAVVVSRIIGVVALGIELSALHLIFGGTSRSEDSEWFTVAFSLIVVTIVLGIPVVALTGIITKATRK